MEVRGELNWGGPVIIFQFSSTFLKVICSSFYENSQMLMLVYGIRTLRFMNYDKI